MVRSSGYRRGLEPGAHRSSSATEIVESQLLRGGGCPIAEGREGVTARGAPIVGERQQPAATNLYGLIRHPQWLQRLLPRE